MTTTARRRSARVPVDLPAQFTHKNREIPGRILNLSVDGAFLRASEMLDSGETIRVSFELPDAQLDVKAKVIWSGSMRGEATGMGLFFDGISAMQQAALELFIRNLLKI
jgi:hypothetical protein